MNNECCSWQNMWHDTKETVVLLMKISVFISNFNNIL